MGVRNAAQTCVALIVQLAVGDLEMAEELFESLMLKKLPSPLFFYAQPAAAVQKKKGGGGGGRRKTKKRKRRERNIEKTARRLDSPTKPRHNATPRRDARA